MKSAAMLQIRCSEGMGVPDVFQVNQEQIKVPHE